MGEITVNNSIIDNAILEQLAQLDANKAEELEFDQLRLYFGEDYWVNDLIVVHQPTVQDFLDCGEKNIYATIAPFTSNPTSYRVQLWDMGIDWNKCEDIELFSMLIKTLNIEYSSIMFSRVKNELEKKEYIDKYSNENKLKRKDKDDFIASIDWKSKELLEPLDFTEFNLYEKKIENSDDVTITLYNPRLEIEIDDSLYKKISTYVRYMFNSHPEVEKCKSNALKKQLIQNDRLKQAKRLQEVQTSNMLSLISFAINHPGFKYKKNELREVGIVEFMDSIQRLQIYESTKALMGGMYSGFCDTSKIDKNEFNFMRDIKVSA